METQTATQEILAPEAAPASLPVAAARGTLPAASNTPSAVLAYAIERGADIAHVEKLLELQMKWEANEARKAYVADMAEFKKNPPQILKDKQVGYKDRNDNFVGYKHATLGNVTNAIVEGLARNGFSHSWDVRHNGHMIEVDCIITHRLGHSERVTMQAGRDDSGKKNAIQQVASAVTYLQRYTLLLATGLATHDQIDDDGASSTEPESLGDVWAAKAKAAASLPGLDQVWKDSMADLRMKNGTQEDHDVILAACKARKAELEANQQPRQPNRSSRLSDIVNQGKEAGQ